MSKVIALGPGGKAQAPERDARFWPVIDHVLEIGGLDRKWLSPRCRNYDHAEEVKRALYRSARYYCSCGRAQCTRRWKNIPHEGNETGGCPDKGQRVSCSADVVTVTDEEGVKHYHVQYRLFDKAEAIREVVAKYGPDPNKWPYFAKRKKERT